MEIFIDINQYIKNKFGVNTDIFYSTGTRYFLLDFYHSGDTCLNESILIEYVSTPDKVKDWVRHTLKENRY
jgi:hypothetical protein